jgi:N-acyl-D-amino-acid deacylase
LARSNPGEVTLMRSDAMQMRLKKAHSFAGSLVAGLLVAASLHAQSSAPSTWSVLVRGGTVVDGTGAPGYRADVAWQGDRIVAVSRTPLDPNRAARVVDATGLIVAPGFIDLHAHLEPLLQKPAATSAVTQGVTLALGGPDGSGPFPLAAYADSADRLGLGINVAYLVGHNTVRTRVMGTENRAPTAAELARMVALVGQGMAEGAFGMSTGLRYVPGYYSTTDEVVTLARAAASAGGIYTSHLREEGLGLLEGVAESITIARDAQIPVVLTHHKAVGQPMWGKSVVTLAMVDSARARGLDVMMDQYPYTASQTSLAVLLPPWALAGGRAALRARVADPALRDSILRGIVALLQTDRGGGDTRRVQFGEVTWDRALEGRTLWDWAEQRGVGHAMEAAAALVLEGELQGGASMVYHIIDEGDVRRIMAHPQTMIASDGRLTDPGEGVPHPRAYGTFPRVLGEYVRTQRVLMLETAVHKMTGMPAARLGLTGRRGCLAAGCAADVVIFDAVTVGSPATFTQPHQYATGIPYVFVNGVAMVDGGRVTTARPGRVVRRGR